MKNILALVLCLTVVFGCEDKDKEHKDCDCSPIAGEMLDGGLESGNEDAGMEEPQAGEEDPQAGEEDVEAGEEVEVDAGEDDPEDIDCEECEGEDCDC